MPIKIIALLMLLIVYLSGTFSLSRLNIGVSADIRFVISIILVFIILTFLKKDNNQFNQFNFKENTLFLFLTIFSYSFTQLISLFYTPVVVLGLEKMVDIFFLFFLCVVTYFLTVNLNKEKFFNIFSTFFIIIGIVYSLPIIFSVISGANRGDVLLSGPNVTTRIVFFAFISSIYKKILTNKTRFFVLSILFLASIVLIGSRGGLISAAFVVLIWVFSISIFDLKFKKIKVKYQTLFLMPFFVFLIYILYTPVKEVFLNRVIGTTFSDDVIYTAGRDDIYIQAWGGIKENPIIGNGIDSFMPLTGYVYPHNLFLEMAFEIGIIGIIIFMIFLYYAMKIPLKWRKSKFYIFSLVPLYMILVQMFSGEIYDFRYYFLLLIPLLVYSKDRKEYTIENSN